MPSTYTIQDIKPSKKHVTITEIDSELLKKAEQRVIQKLSQELKLKGFRPGKIPENIVRETVEAAFIEQRSIEEAIPFVLQEIGTKHPSKMISRPEVKLESFAPLKIEASWDVYPEAKLGDLSTIAVKKKKVEVTAEELKAALDHVQKRLIEYREVDRIAKKDDRVDIDFEGFAPDGVPLENTSSKHYPLVLGAGLFIPGFEEAVTGMKKGEEKTFEVTMPKDYHVKHLAGKQVKFKVKANKVEEGKLPEFNEAFVEKVTGKKDSVEAWTTSVKQQIHEEKDVEAKRVFEDEFYKKLIELTIVELPASLVSEEQQGIMREVKQNILRYGLSFEHYLSTLKKNEEELLKSFETQAKERVTLRIALETIAKEEKIEVSDLEIEERLKELQKDAPDNQQKKIKAVYQEGTQAHEMLRYQMMMQKTLEKIMPKA